MDCKKTWIQCSRSVCSKWRVVTDEIAAKYAEIPWTCEMNEDRHYNKCSVPEEKVDVPRGKKVVVTKLPYEKGEIIMAKMAGYCLWPALITPDPNCDEYYDAVLNDNDEQEEFTHIHVEFFGRPRTHGWVQVKNAFPYTGSEEATTKPKWKRLYNIAMEDAMNWVPLTCEERLQRCAFRIKQDSQTLPIFHCDSNSLMKRGRLRKLPRMESNSSYGVSSSRNCGGYDCKKDAEKTSSKQISTEEVLSSRKNRRRKPATIKTSSSTSLPSYSSPDIVVSKESDDVEVLEAQNEVFFQPIFNKLPHEKKPRKRKPKKFVSPFLTTTILDANKTVKEKQTSTEIVVEDTAPEMEFLDEQLQPYSTIEADVQKAIVMKPLPELDSSSTFSNQAMDKRNVFIQEQHNMRITTVERLQTAVHSTLPGGSSLAFNFCRTGEFTDLVTDTNAATTNIKESSTQSTSEKYQSDISENNACIKPQNFAFIDEQCSKPCSKISGYEYVRSSNPNSPQLVPTEEELEDDCEISIRRELEEMERVLQCDACLDLKGMVVIKKKSNFSPPVKLKPVEDSVPLTDDLVQDAINQMLKLEEDISRLEDASELDFM